ncbi:MAG: class GN sortase [Halioglobus sp.]|nr:class GN sortase [Halioglobus sp.]
MCPRRALERGRDALAVALLAAALLHGAGAALIHAKAWLAPLLIERAWSRTLAHGGAAVKPWPWADTWPVAKLRAPGQGIERLVLAGDSGNALAFGPGHARASAPLGAAGLAVIGGHRDTHFAFLRHLRRGDRLQLQTLDGRWRDYRVEAARVVDVRRERLSPQPGREALLLVTCYPFDAVFAGGPLRYAVRAIPVAPRSTLL